MAVVFAVAQKNGPMQPIFHIDLGALCAQYENTNFSDLALEVKRCEIEPAVVADWPNQCRRLKEQIDSSYQTGFPTCESAKDTFERQGCGSYTCPAQKQK